MTIAVTLPGFDYRFVHGLALGAGKIMTQHFSPHGVDSVYKPSGGINETPVTPADKQINAMIIRQVRSRFPDQVSIQGEEGSDTIIGVPWKVVFDPLDGTFPYAAGIPISTFMIALLNEGRPMLAAIYDPFMSVFYYAERGGGSFANGNPIRVSKDASLGTKTIINAIWWVTSDFEVGKIAGRLCKHAPVPVHNYCSVGYAGARVASGLFIASIFPGLDAHDSAALDLIVSEAGGKVTDIEGNEQRYDGKVRGHLATNGLVHDTLLGLMNQIRNEAS